MARSELLPAALRQSLHALALVALIPVLAACSSGSSGTGGTVRSAGSVAVRTPTRLPPRAPTFQTIPGLEGVIGATQGQLVGQFGTPRLDVWEGDARKLQYTGTACVLDIYLYPTTQSREPLASYVDARRGSDGQDVDRAACVAALRRGR